MRKALVIGIDSYEGSPLSGCVNDANLVAKCLERHENESVNCFVRKYLDVQDKGTLKGHIIDCFSGDAEIALFYFSGHGYIDSVGGYIVTPDYSEHDMGVSMQEILAIVNNLQRKNKAVILDCCHSGFMGNTTLVGHQMSVISEGVTIITASKSDESAIETGGHGVFTSLLLEALNGGASDVT